MKEMERASSAQLRSRQLDFNTKINVVFPSEEEIATIESQSSHFAPVPTKKRKKHEFEDETEIGSISVKEGRGAPKDIVPIPGIRLLDPDKEATPTKRVRHNQSPALYVHKDIVPEESELKVPEYDLDDEDEEFLQALAGSTKLALRTKGGKSNIKITEELFEALIEIFEIEFYHAQFSHQSPEGLFHFAESKEPSCSVCGGSDREEENQMIFCKACDLSVHILCYGLSELEEDWTCQRCLQEDSEEIGCCYCPSKKGALKPTDELNIWAHISCGLWIPGVEIEDIEKMEPIEGPSAVDDEMWNKSCCICGLESGVSVDCDEPGCKLSLHVTCGRENGYTLELDEKRSPVQCLLYCRQHSIKHEIEKKKSFDLDPLNPLQIQELDRIAKLYITNYKAHDQRRNGVQGVFLAKTYLFWRWKRNRNAGSFLRKYQQPMTEDKKLVLRGGLSDRDYAIRFRRLRQEFERLRMIIDQVRKREILKRDQVRLIQQEFELDSWRQKLIVFGKEAFSLPVFKETPKKANPKPVFFLSDREPKRKRGRPKKLTFEDFSNAETHTEVSDQEEPEEVSDKEIEEEIHDEQDDEDDIVIDDEQVEEEQETRDEEGEEEEEEEQNEESADQSDDDVQIDEEVNEQDEENEEDEGEDSDPELEDEIIEDQEEEIEEEEEEMEEEKKEDNEDESPKKNIGKTPLKRVGHRSPPASPASGSSSPSLSPLKPAPKRKGRTNHSSAPKEEKKEKNIPVSTSSRPLTRGAKKVALENSPKGSRGGKKAKAMPTVTPNGRSSKSSHSKKKKGR